MEMGMEDAHTRGHPSRRDVRLEAQAHDLPLILCLSVSVPVSVPVSLSRPAGRPRARASVGTNKLDAAETA